VNRRWLQFLYIAAPAALLLRGAANRAQSSSSASGVSKREPISAELGKQLLSLRLRYLSVFLAMKFADWLQGPYFYDVYATKVDSRTGVLFTPAAISSLFLVGFCSAMIFGAFAGSWADKFGRWERVVFAWCGLSRCLCP
jgi:hypothetical protein